MRPSSLGVYVLSVALVIAATAAVAESPSEPAQNRPNSFSVATKRSAEDRRSAELWRYPSGFSGAMIRRPLKQNTGRGFCRADSYPPMEVPTSEQCAALADLYSSTDGPHWLNRDGWADRSALLANCCMASGVICDDDLNVIGLSFSTGYDGNGLNGPIPSSFAVLDQMVTLCVTISCVIRETPLSNSPDL